MGRDAPKRWPWCDRWACTKSDAQLLLIVGDSAGGGRRPSERCGHSSNLSPSTLLAFDDRACQGRGIRPSNTDSVACRGRRVSLTVSKGGASGRRLVAGDMEGKGTRRPRHARSWHVNERQTATSGGKRPIAAVRLQARRGLCNASPQRQHLREPVRDGATPLPRHSRSGSGSRPAARCRSGYLSPADSASPLSSTAGSAAAPADATPAAASSSPIFASLRCHSSSSQRCTCLR